MALRTLLPGCLFKRFFGKRPSYIRCKYCGRFVRFIDPNEGFAYLGGNECPNCGRSYPMPSFAWDSVGGQGYMFYRRSVSEAVFYRDIVRLFDVRDFNDDVFGGSKAPGL